MFRSLFRSAALASSVAALACAPVDNSENPDNTGDETQGIACDGDVCVLSGTITEDVTLTADKMWLLRGGVFIGDDASETVLTIEPGTTIFGETSTNGLLVVTRGSKIMAEGTVDAPIVFTSSKEDGSRARGDWGGLIINGRAPVNGCETSPCEAFGEGGTGFYGADIANDSSGVLKYVRVEFAGRLISPDNELNGIAFQGVGSGTTVDYVQIHMGKDDGVEFFGGTVNVKHLLLTGIADDNLDWTDGWTGKAQFIIAQQYDDAGDNGIEADNNAEDNGALPRSHPTISNVTLIGVPSSDQSDVGMLLREGTGADISNAIVMGWNDVCLDIDHAETFANARDASGPTGELVVRNTIFDCATNFEMDDEDFDGDTVNDSDPWNVEDYLTTDMSGNRTGSAGLSNALDTGEGRDFRPDDGSIAKTGAIMPSDDFFEVVDFVGGMGADDWTAGWTTSVRD